MNENDLLFRVAVALASGLLIGMERGWRDRDAGADAAEFLVLVKLLLEGVVAHKNYTKIPEYDLVATDPEVTFSVTIQVKSQWETDRDKGFFIRGMYCDFLVFVALNRGVSKREEKEREGRRLRPKGTGVLHFPGGCG